MNKDFDGSIVNFMKDQEESFRKTFFSTREIADAVGLTIYQVREHLDALQSFSVVENGGWSPVSSVPSTRMAVVSTGIRMYMCL
ncbi:hypothetical protein J3N82_003980 [Salmonella enterica subsp. enterica serovar Bareilly]|nr:hypothetical protein [Salmonella enterica subsp. enterica serovar Bareilly]